MNVRRLPLSLMLCALALLGYTRASYADLIDPSTLQVGPGGTTDPVEIGNSGLVTVTNVSTGAADLNVPWLLILGIPNVTSTTASITEVNGTSDSITSNGTTATMTSGQEAYSQLGITGANNSNSFTNWAKAESTINSITATSFGLFEFNIPVTLSGGGTDTFQFANLPLGTFVIAEGDDSKNLYDTPFTESGLTDGMTTVPEPASLTIFGTALVGLGAAIRRRRKDRV